MGYARNLRILEITAGLGWARFFIPVFALFYIASQVTILEFSVVLSVFALVTLLLEIPSGVVADIIGKKNTLLISTILFFIEILILAYFNGFIMLLIAKIVSGVALSMLSGTRQALLFDSLKRLRKSNEYKKYAGIQHFVQNISMFVVFVIGGYLFSIDPKLTAILSLPFAFFNIVFTIFIKEPYPNKKKLNIKTSFKHLKESLIYVKSSSYVKFIILFYVPISIGIVFGFNMGSIYFTTVGIPLSFIGIVAALAPLVGSITSKNADSLETKLGENKSLLLLVIVLVLSHFLMGFLVPIVGIIFCYMISFVNTFSIIILDHYVNHHAKTSHRASILSVKNMFGNLSLFLLLPVFGYIVQNKSLSLSYFSMAGFIVVYFVLLLPVFRKLSSNS